MGNNFHRKMGQHKQCPVQHSLVYSQHSLVQLMLITLHVGMNDVDIHSVEEVADNIIKLTDDIKNKMYWIIISGKI